MKQISVFPCSILTLLCTLSFFGFSALETARAADSNGSCYVLVSVYNGPAHQSLNAGWSYRLYYRQPPDHTSYPDTWFYFESGFSSKSFFTYQDAWKNRSIRWRCELLKNGQVYDTQEAFCYFGSDEVRFYINQPSDPTPTPTPTPPPSGDAVAIPTRPLTFPLSRPSKLGRVVAWGASLFNPPTDLGSVVQISAGGRHCLALRADGTVVGWGINGYGELTIPAGLSNVVKVIAAGAFSLALKTDGTVTAWGRNDYNQYTGLSSLTNIVDIYSHPDTQFGAAVLALKRDGTITISGLATTEQQSFPAGLTNIVQLGGGDRHTIALRADGSALSWGTKFSGADQVTMPSGLGSLAQVAACVTWSAALKTNGTVQSWGSSEGAVPSGLSSVVQLAAGSSHLLALKRNGTVVAWGNNSSGQTSVPASLTNVIQISAGGFHSIALVELPSPPVITTHPAWQLVQVGTNVTFSVSASGAPPLSYQWRKDNVNISGATNDSYTIMSVTSSNSGQYSCYVSNDGGGALSSQAVLAVTKADPEVSSWPVAASIFFGQALSNSALIGGSASVPGSFAWTFPDALPNSIGTDTNKVTFIPNDASSYSTVTTNILLTVKEVTPMLVVEQPAGSAVTNNSPIALSGGTLAGSTSTGTVFTIRNSGYSKLNSIAVVKSGGNAVEFELSPPLTNSLAAGDSTTFSVSFVPNSGGAKNTQLYLFSNDTNSPFIINVSGFGLGENLDTDGDGLNDAAEFTMSELGFDWQSNQPTLVSALLGNAKRAGLYTSNNVATNAAAFGLFTQTQFDGNRFAGRQDVVSSPMSYGLYTSNSITDLRMGGLMIQKNGSNAVVSFQPQTTTDLTLPFTNNGTPITHEIPMPDNKGFIRINAKP